MRVTVSYPITFEVPETIISDDIFETQNRIKERANDIFQDVRPEPIITDCDDDEYIE